LTFFDIDDAAIIDIDAIIAITPLIADTLMLIEYYAIDYLDAYATLFR
jgi:hypothetical protein